MRSWIRNILLLWGTALIVVSGAFTLRYQTDQAVFIILIPGFVFGLILIVMGIRMGATRRL